MQRYMRSFWKRFMSELLKLSKRSNRQQKQTITLHLVVPKSGNRGSQGTDVLTHTSVGSRSCITVSHLRQLSSLLD